MRPAGLQTDSLAGCHVTRTCALWGSTAAQPSPARAEGVLYAEKDFNLAKHPEIPDVPNLQVIKLMQSFKSKELVTERFAWRHYYWCASHGR